MLVPLAMLVIIAGFASVLVGLTGAMAASALLNHAAVLVLAVMDALIRLGAARAGHVVAGGVARTVARHRRRLTVLLAVMLAGYAHGWRGWARTAVPGRAFARRGSAGA